jgi:cell division protein FtsL
MSQPGPSTIRRNIDRRGLHDFLCGTAACALVACGLLLHAGVRTLVTERGYRLSRLFAEYRELSREHDSLQLSAAELVRPQRIEELARTRLGMGPPTRERMIVLVGGTAVTRPVATAAR